MSTIPTQDLLTQSPYLYLQGAGSDGSDGTASGIHLRWDMLGDLGESHIPKGNLTDSPSSPYYINTGYNKADDFVEIYRTAYNKSYPVVVDFATMQPSEVIDIPGVKAWRFNNIIPVSGSPANARNVIMRFPNVTQYNRIKQLYDPLTDCLSFLKNYKHVIEAEVEGLLMFSAKLYMQVNDNSKSNIARIESISLIENNGSDDLFISNRKKFVTDIRLIIKEELGLLLQENNQGLELEESGSGNRQIIAENIKYIRFRGDNCYPSILWLETYDDFIAGKNSVSEWEKVTQLALSIDDNEVFDRLEKTGDYDIDNQWPRFNENDKVKVANYKDKWLDGTGVKEGVIEYLTLSTDPTNPQAINPPEIIDPEEMQEGFSFSYLSILKLTAFDFHIARMLGFGHIDTEVSSPSDRYIYTAVYRTVNPSTVTGVKTHTYTTLPVGKPDSKLPVAPELKNIRYGMSVENGTDEPTLITDINGYSLYDDTRTINLDIVPFETDKEFEGFFLKDEEFSYVDRTKPIMYGVEYRNRLAINWQRPGINIDANYIDYNGFPEIVPITGKDETQLYTHTEINEGEHVYAVYGINWFSRASILSNSVMTDETVFPVRNTLIPPLNFGVQLIQEENPLIFTTQTEQAKLNALTGDKTLVRLTFDWNNVHAASYWYGKQAAFFFRDTALNFVRGRIKSVTRLNGVGTFELRTEAYTIYSHSPVTVVMPSITVGTEENYVNSLFSIDNDQFVVESIIPSAELGEGPIFTVKAPGETAILEPDLDNQLLTVDHTPVPLVGKNFSVAENTSLSSSWPVALQAKVVLKKFSDHQETVIHEDGDKIINVGGIFEKASIAEFEDKDNFGNFIPGSKTGLYAVTFNSYVLEPHEDPNVEWYKGSARVTAPDGTMRSLEVWNIDLSTSSLKLIVYDSTFDVDNSYEPQNGYTPIDTGANIDVNFHPGYRVYLEAEVGFDESTILPEIGAGEKKTFMACLSEDTTEGIKSYLSTPAILLAREIIKPLQPEEPIGPAFATRPDFYGKATYTFDTKMNTQGNTREPYALIFYRSDERIILETLYKSETVAQIITDLAALENDEGYNSRWNELVNAIVDDSTDAFKIWNGYGFPNPDNNNFKIPNPNPIPAKIAPFDGNIVPGSDTIVAGTAEIFGTAKTYYEIVQMAINGVFLPLTEQPVIYKYLKNNVYQTSAKKPVIRDRDGNLLIPGSGDYDAAPMAVKFTEGSNKMLRFTDYTLDGASKAIYFYYVIEMNDTLSLGERSEITGPIQLIDTSAPKAPEFRKFYTQPDNATTGELASVIFEINDYPENEGINKILIYRTFDIDDALSIQSMELAAVIDISEPVIDDFSDLGFLPYGEVLYYKLVAVRTIQNEFNEPEDVPSMPSSLVLTNIIDTVNPPAPSLSYTVGSASTDELLKDVTLIWEPTVYNGTYYLYQMNSVGNWEKIYSIKTNDPEIQYQLPNDLVKFDEDDDERYYRFKVSVENSSGLMNLDEQDLII